MKISLDDFEKFLKEERVFSKYQARYVQRAPFLKAEHSLPAMPKNCIHFLAMIKAHPKTMMTKCFVWKKTPEGQKFWSEINRKWQLILFPPKEEKKES